MPQLINFQHTELQMMLVNLCILYCLSKLMKEPCLSKLMKEPNYFSDQRGNTTFFFFKAYILSPAIIPMRCVKVLTTRVSNIKQKYHQPYPSHALRFHTHND